jgi:hypothetical protein
VGLTNLGSEQETCVGSRVHLVGVFISFEKNFYRLPFTPPLWFAVSVLQFRRRMDGHAAAAAEIQAECWTLYFDGSVTSTNAIIYDHYLVTISCLVIEVLFVVTKKIFGHRRLFFL